ncbi:MAG: glycoside hydrolase family 88 protein [Spirochaetota bacterium]
MYVPLTPLNPSTPALPPEKRTIFGRPTFEITPERHADLVLGSGGSGFTLPGRYARAWLQLTVGFDIRETYTIEAGTIPESGPGERIGELDVRYGYTLQPFRMEIPSDFVTEVLSRGLRLGLVTEAGGLQFLKESNPADMPWQSSKPQPVWGPVVYFEGTHQPAADPGARLEKLLSSPFALQPFGWMEGCVLDGIWNLYSATESEATIRKHLSMFTDDSGQLSYEDARSRAKQGVYPGIEYTLPAAAFARVDPAAPAVEAAHAFWKQEPDNDGLVTDEEFVSAEGCYTLSYPMALVGTLRKDAALVRLAKRQLEIRWRLLHSSEALQLRFGEKSIETYRGWARAYAWFLLGLAYAVPLIEELESATELRSMARRLTEEAARAQIRETGLFACFLKEELPPDTSGSAGIGAAVAMAVQAGIVESDYRSLAEGVARGLDPHISEDGLLGGVAQSNRGGEALQRSRYRVFSQMGSGLAAQLYGVLER